MADFYLGFPEQVGLSSYRPNTPDPYVALFLGEEWKTEVASTFFYLFSLLFILSQYVIEGLTVTLILACCLN